MKKLLSVVLLVFLSLSVQAQDKDYDNDIRFFMEINGTMGQYRDALDQLNKMLKEQYKDAGVKASDWKEIEGVGVESLTGLENDLIVVYKKFFTHDEIKELNKLYSKDVAQKFISNVVSITNASQNASMVWSRNLYNRITDLLHEKGYTTQ